MGAEEDTIARLKNLLGSMLAAPPFANGTDSVTVKVKVGLKHRANELLDANKPWPGFKINVVE
jgi:hypothetical protein